MGDLQVYGTDSNQGPDCIAVVRKKLLDTRCVFLAC